jgi:hypothetical protein
MNNKELGKKIARLKEKVLYPPNRNRVCFYCEKEFYAYNLNQQSCSKKCYHTYYNERVRGRKELESITLQLKAEEEALEELKRSLNTRENILRKNIEIIDHLTIDPLTGTCFDIQSLHKLGIDFTEFDFREKVSKSDDSFELVMGSYRLALLINNEICIKNNSI